VKKENPALSHREAFKKAAKEWNISPENPKNQSRANESKKETTTIYSNST
jgi:hypothetical protein